MEISLEKYEAMQDRIAHLEVAMEIKSKQLNYALDLVAERDKKIYSLRAKQPHWISVKDRLPEEDDVLGAPGITESNPVLVTVRLAAYGFDSPAVSIAYTRNGEWVLSAPELVAQSLRVIAWMPLPEPPEVEDGNGE